MEQTAGGDVRIVNLTPHDILVRPNEGSELRFQSEGQARVRVETKVKGDIAGVPVVSQEYKDVEGLPEPEEGVFYIVSLVVRQALPDREDLVSPDTSPEGAIRNEKGQIVAVKRFVG